MNTEENGSPLEVQAARFDRETMKAYIEDGERERANIVAHFPIVAWKDMPLEKYALGVANYKETFSYFAEFGSQHLGSMQGGSARKLLIYKKNDGGWYFDPEYQNKEKAWATIRGAFVDAFVAAQEGDWTSIDALLPIQGARALRVKTLHIYFPTEILPIFSRGHIRHFLTLFKRPEAEDRQLGVIGLNRALLMAVRSLPAFKDWRTNEIQRFLYLTADPREKHRIVKIAPGEEGRFWDDCQKGHYICVGWDDVTDLRTFDSKDSFKDEFANHYSKGYNNHGPTISKKAQELWTLRELEPGDIVVANKGTSEILAIGTVVEPGYEWLGSRAEFKHVVHVDWDASYAKKIQPQKRWPFLTVAPVSAALYRVLTGSQVNGPTPPPMDLPFEEIEAALTRKGQVILYGPPGTGKTYIARRFAVFWLSQKMGKPNPQKILVDPNLFEETERELSTVQVNRRVWWIVANPKEWAWDQLFVDKHVSYRYGRLRRNYPLVQKGDLVIGYQAGTDKRTDKRIAALARISKEFTTNSKDGQHIELVPVARINDGPTYKQLSEDHTLKESEPIRFRNQGTLFALTTPRTNRNHSL